MLTTKKQPERRSARRLALGLLTSSFCFLGALGPGRAHAQSSTPREETWVTDGAVRAIACTQDTVYIGGPFTYVARNTGSGVPIDAATGQPVDPFPKVDGTVWVCRPDGAGGWYIGGAFTRVGVFARNRIAHILADGSVDPAWNPNASNEVWALAVSGSTVYAGGLFTSISGQARNRMAHILADGSVDPAWNPNANGDIRVLAVSGSVVYAGGNFTSIGGQARNRIAALDAATGAATSWNPNANNPIQDLAVSGSTVYAAGLFTSIGGQTRQFIAALDTATGAAIAWNPNASNYVYGLSVSGSTVYVGGEFWSIGGQPRDRIAALDAATGAATAWNPGANDPVAVLAVSGSTVYVGGLFTNIGGQSRNYTAALDTGTGAATAWDPNPNGLVNTLAISGSTVYTGGDFTGMGGQSRNGIAALDAATGAPTAWNPNASGGRPTEIWALAVSGSTIYAGGWYTSIGGQSRRYIAALDAATGNATAWNPNANSGVHALAISGSTVYAGGWFTQIGGQSRTAIAALDSVTGNASAWNPSPSGGSPTDVQALAVSGSTVYAGGWFTSMGGQARNRIAALDAATGAATAWNPNANNGVYALEITPVQVYVGGYFTSIGGRSRNYIAALDIATGAATAWNPNANNRIEAVATSGSTIYAGGNFTFIGGQMRNRIAALDAATGAATAWNPNASGWVYALAITDSSLYAGGRFTNIGGDVRPYFAQFDFPMPVPDAPSNPGADSITSDSIRWTWTDNSTNETGFKVWADEGPLAPATLRTTTPADSTDWTHEGLSPNSAYTFQVAATNAFGDSAKTTPYTAWTLAAVPAAPVVSDPTTVSLRVAVDLGDGNPSGTEYAIWCATTEQWVQASGALGASEVWNTALTWGAKTVTGLLPDELYEFQVKARNGEGVETALGSAASLRTLSWSLAARHWGLY